jgi:membrane protease subunit HflK
MIPDQQSYSRATRAAIGGLVIQFGLSIIMLFCALASQSDALFAAAAHLFGGIPIWGVLVVLYYQYRLERAEALEAESLAKSQARATTVFEESGVDLQAAKRKLDNIQKYGLNVVGVGVALYLIAFGSLYLYKASQEAKAGMLIANLARGITAPLAGVEPGNPALVLVGAIMVAFGAFITARYQAGMTQINAWQQLRGGASYLVGNFIVALLVAISFGAWLWESKAVLAVVTFIIPAMMIVLGLETLAIFMLGAYRPRRPGEVARSSFDSRILGLLTSPKSLAKALSDAIAYQFGVDVSSSWFFQLVSQSIVKLVCLAVVAVWLMSAIVVVQPHEQALISRFGKPVAVSEGNYVWGPGLHLMLPWPFGDEDIFPVQRIQQIEIGSAKGRQRPGTAILWTNTHGASETDKEDFFVTAPTTLTENSTVRQNTAGQQNAPGTNLAGAQIVVQYRVTDLYLYFRKSQPQLLPDGTMGDRILRNIAEREINRFFIVRDIDTLVLGDRTVWAKDLRAKIQEQVKQDDLGIEVVFVGLTAIHPPSNNEVAVNFQKQVGAMQEYQTEIEKANRDAIKMLASVAGSRERAMEIKKAIDDLQTSENKEKDAEAAKAGDLDDLKKEKLAAQARVDDLFATAGTSGDAALLLAQARAFAWERGVSQGAKADRFASELQAYRAAPELYRMRQYLNILADGMTNSRKIIMSTRSDVPPTFRIDLKDSASTMSKIMQGN